MKKTVLKILLLLFILNSISFAQEFNIKNNVSIAYFNRFNSYSFIQNTNTNIISYRNFNKLIPDNILFELLEVPQNNLFVTKKLFNDNFPLNLDPFGNEIKNPISYEIISLVNQIKNPKFIPDYRLNYLSNFYFTKHKTNLMTTPNINLLALDSQYGKMFINNTTTLLQIGAGMVGVLMILPRSVTKWEEGFMDDALQNLDRAFSNPPVMDEDHWEINYIGHPYAGSIYYNAFRSKNSTIFQSFMFSVFASTTWEYVLEGVAEQPSIQDLIITPIAGSILGELIHRTTLGMRKNGFNFFEKMFVTIFNPMYVIHHGYN